MFFWRRLFKALLGICLCVCLFTGGLVFWSAETDSAFAQTSPQASISQDLFTVQCAACHASGGNIIRRGKTLKQKALKRYGYDDVAAIAALITQGKGAMPAFADRLTPDEISAIAQYVQQQAATGW